MIAPTKSRLVDLLVLEPAHPFAGPVDVSMGSTSYVGVLRDDKHCIVGSPEDVLDVYIDYLYCAVIAIDGDLSHHSAFMIRLTSAKIWSEPSGVRCETTMLIAQFGVSSRAERMVLSVRSIPMASRASVSRNKESGVV